MKTTLNWYKREANSYNFVGIRHIRRKWNFQGAYMFIAFCDLIVTLEGCYLDLERDKAYIELLCLDMDFKPEDFKDYLNDLLKYKLVVELGDFKYSTQEIQESLAVTMEDRVKAYIRKYGKEPNYLGMNEQEKSSAEPEQSSTEPEQSSEDMTGELSKVRENFSQRERPERKEKPERPERENFALAVFTNEFLSDLKDNFSKNELELQNYQKSFLKFMKMAKKSWKSEDDFRRHFLNWLKLEIEKDAKKPQTKKVGSKRNY